MEEEKRPLINWKILLAIVATAIVCAIVFWLFFGKAVIAGYRYSEKYAKLEELAAVVDTCYIGDYSYENVMDGMAAGLIDGLGDRWSYYVSRDEVEAYDQMATNTYVGIGVTVQKAVGEYMDVQSVEDDGGAYDAGMKPGDKIIAVEGTDVFDMTTSEVKEMIVGPEGTTVTITIERDGKRFDVNPERRTLKSKTVESQMIDDVAYIRILNFFEGSSDEMIKAFEDLTGSGAEKVVFDVRFNGGGYLDELMKMLDYLLPEGVIFREEDIDGNESVINSDESHVEIPIAILVNDLTFSAAEYFAEAIREFDMGIIVGDNTTGKGYSQVFIPLSDGSGVNLSTMKYFTPNGTCLIDVGVTPDIKVEISDEEYFEMYYDVLDIGDDTQLKAAIEVLS